MFKIYIMKLLVTGGLGFIGSNFIINLLKNNKNHDITNIDDCLYGSNLMNVKEIENYSNYSFVRGNITNYSLMKKLISNSDAIINFAAESFVDRSISNAEPFIESNIKGVFNILEIIKEEKKKFLQISTDEVFGSLREGTANEESKFNPSSPYAATKTAAEILISSYVTTYDCDCLITRCTNNFGPRQFPEKLIPKVILLALQNKEIPIYGNGKNIRDWLFVDDHCDAINNVLQNGKSGESYNISSNKEINNLSIVKKILSLLDKSEELIKFVEDRPGHDYRYSMSSTKIKNELGWTPKLNFDQALENTVKWYVSNNNWWADLNKDILSSTPWKNNFPKGEQKN